MKEYFEFQAQTRIRNFCSSALFRVSALSFANAIELMLFLGQFQIDPVVEVHDVVTCLKRLLRETPETVLTNRLYALFAESGSSPSHLQVFQLDEDFFVSPVYLDSRSPQFYEQG